MPNTVVRKKCPPERVAEARAQASKMLEALCLDAAKIACSLWELDEEGLEKKMGVIVVSIDSVRRRLPQ